MKEKFYRCNMCGNLIDMVVDSTVVPVCCGKAMQELVANTSDGATEKHVPSVKVEKDVVHVQVGSTIHPSTEAHHIVFVVLVTDKGVHRKYLEVGKDPIVEFAVHQEKPLEVYEYCNLHGLWKTKL